MYYYVYRITCHHPDSPSKYYYGYRSCNIHPTQDEYWSSSEYVKQAIALYGKQFFKKKIIQIFDDRVLAIQLEMRLHEKFNVDVNGIFFNRCKQTQWGFGCTGAVVKGKTYEEIYGDIKAAELKALRSKNALGRNHSGINNPMYGKAQTAEVKQKLSDQRSGEGHPMFGWVWITDGINNAKINPITDAVPEGWIRGRTHKSKPPSHLGTVFINDGHVTKKIPKTEDIPSGWYRGRLRR